MSRIRLHGGEVDLVRLRVQVGGASASLTAMEARLLAYLASHAGRAVGQAELLQEVWGYSPKVKSRTVETTVGRLRLKLEPDPARPAHLVTVPSQGYQLVVAEAAPPRRPGALLSPSEARQLLRSRSELRDEELDAVLEPLGGHPRAIELAAEWSRTMSARDLAHQLATAPLRLLRDVEAELEQAVAKLGADGRATLVQAAVFRGGFGVPAAERVIRVDGWIGDALRGLVEGGLLRRDGDRYEVPPLVAAFAATDVPADAVERHRAWALEAGEALAVARRRSPEALDALAAEIGNLRAAFERAPDADVAARLFLAAEPALSARGPWDALIGWAGAAIARGPAAPVEARVRAALARALVWTGRLDEAEAVAERATGALEGLLAAADVAIARGRAKASRIRDLSGAALRAAREAGDERSEGVAERQLGVAARYEGATEEDERLAESARLLRRAGDRPELADTLRMQADALRLRRHLADARRHAEHALEHARGDARREAIVLETLAGVLAEEARLDEAAAQLEGAAARHRSLGARRREMHVLLRLGEVRLAQGALDAAEEALEEAAGAALDLADARLEAAIRQTTSRVRWDQGRFLEARELGEAAARTFQELGERFHLALARLVTAQAAHASRDLPAAVEAYREAAAAFAGMPGLEGPALAGLAIAQLGAGDRVGADETIERLRTQARAEDRRLVGMIDAARTGATDVPAPVSRDERLLARLIEDLTGL